MDLEAIAAATTAGLAASAIERPTGEAGEPHHACTDCGAEVTGRFCSNCGQPAHVHRSLLHLGEELLHGVMHFDSRTWRTLPLLVFRPGTLTREWVHGRRTRYVSPLAMFLFTIFVMFMALSYLPGKPVETLEQQRASAAVELAKERAVLAAAEAKLKAALPEDRSDAAGDVKSALADVKDATDELAEVKALKAPEDWRLNLKAETASGKLRINTGNKKLDEKIRHKFENPELAIYKLQQTVYKFSFLLVPISIPFVALLFLWKRGFTLYDHGVFVLYSLTFMALLAMAEAGIARLGPWTSWLLWLGLLAVPTHMFFQLKGAYGMSGFSALWRTGVLLVFCLITITLFTLAIVVLGAG